MCGIVGYIGKKDCVRFLVDGLKRVEYRGYDSAGIFVYQEKNKEYSLVKNVGKIAELEKSIDKSVAGNIGIAHTRWATHGEPNHDNSHPHISNDGSIYLVHNGIIENYTSLKKKLEKHGFTFYSETDTEILAVLNYSRQIRVIQSCISNAEFYLVRRGCRKAGCLQERFLRIKADVSAVGCKVFI